MRIQIGTKYITQVPKNRIIPCNCDGKPCSIDFLWYAGWRVRLWKFGFIKLLIWSQK